MKAFLTIVSYLFHPLFIPLGGTVAYFLITPKYTPLDIQGGTILPVFILTIIIPIVTYLILKNIGIVHTMDMPTAAERRYPVAIYLALLLMILYKVLPNNYVAEIYYFFIGLLGAAFTCLLLLLLNFKASLHLAGAGALFMYLVCLSVHFEINVTIAISLFTLIIGLVTSSRLFLKATTRPELVAGLCIGILSQLLTVKYWL